MLYVFNLPDVGEGINEGEVVKWFVRAGDTIKEDDPLMELQNDKLLQEIPSPVTGKIKRILVAAGTVATVGDALVEIETDSVKSANKNTTNDSHEANKNTEQVNNQVAEKVVDAKDSDVSYPDNSIGGRVLAMPSVRQYALAHEIDLTKISATGSRGHVTKVDVDTAIAMQVNTSQAGAPIEMNQKSSSSTMAESTIDKEPTRNQSNQLMIDDKSDRRERFSITRKAISRAMMTSKTKSAHVSLFDEVEVSNVIAHREKFKQIAGKQDVKLTYMPYLMKALIAVVRKYPILMASVDEEKDEIIYKNRFNIGVAVDTDHGLYVPNIKNADTKGMFAIAREITVLTDAAKAGKLAGSDMREGTITITNIGSVGGMWFTPIINYPEVSILGVGRIVKKPIVVEDGSIGVGNMMMLSLSFDHRIIDGKTAQLAMNELKRLLVDPDLLLMEG